MAYFECVFGGAIGASIPLIVTCDSAFAGQTIICTDGTKTLTQTCPSTSPYEVEFMLPNIGTWTVSGAVEGATYSQQVVITDFDVTLTAGFDYKQWLTLGGLDPTDYASLSEVFADEVAVRRLMTIHTSADYLIEKVTDDIDTIDDFVANDTAMKWIGLRDYVCDSLTAIAGVEAKFLASQYWERYLKDHVPIMTSNTAPYGNTVAPNEGSNTPTYYAFDGNPNTNATNNAAGHTEHGIGYKFVNPICPKKATIYLSTTYTIDTLSIQGSNDGTNWVNISEVINNPTKGINLDVPLNTSEYYLYVRARMTGPTSSRYGVYTLQFYGRALDVSVPVMTSNTAPYGTVSATSILSGNDAYRAFDGNDSTQAMFASNTTNNRLVYKFTNPICVKRMYWLAKASQAMPSDKPYIIQGSNDGSTWVDLYNGTYPKGNEYVMADIDNNDYYLYYGVFCPEVMYVTSSWACGFYTFQFYGVDYSEREFAEGSTMKYLYDHGVELEELNSAYTSTPTVVAPTKEDTQIYFPALTSGSEIGVIGTTNKLDLTDYSFLRMTDGDKGVLASNKFGYVRVLNTKDSSSGIVSELSLITMSSMIGRQVLDVSSINAEYYVAVLSGNANRQYSFTELWLE